MKEKNENKDYIIKGRLQEKDEQINNLQESIKFLSDRFNAFLISQPENKIVYDNDENVKGNVNGNKTNNNTDPRNLKGIELKPEINNKAVGQVISSKSNKKK